MGGEDEEGRAGKVGCALPAWAGGVKAERGPG